jgi:hypothetical protein
MRKYLAERYQSRKAEGVVKLGGKCAGCGTTENLEFDHVDRADKTKSIAKLMIGSLENFRKELEKCQLLCSSCHQRKTSSEMSVPHGGGKSGRKNCKCRPCKNRKNEYMREFRRKTAGV